VRIPNTKEPGHFYRHQIEHLLAFGATGLIFLGLSRSRREDWKAAAAVVLLGTAIEIAQYAIYRMPFGFEWWDVREDTIGAVLALIVDRSTGVRRWLISGQR
jgi:VanZ family protein